MGLRHDQERFDHDLRLGYRWQCWVATLLEERGFRTQVDPLSVSPDFDHNEEHADDGDVFVFVPGGRCKFSVKTQPTSFTSPSDFPYARAIVDTVRGWDRSPSSAVLQVGRPTKGILVIPATTRELWKIDDFPTPDGLKPCYWVSPEHCRTFDELCLWLETARSLG